MHTEVLDFCKYVKHIFPSYFNKKKIHEVGSGDINGNASFLFEFCKYSGNDVAESSQTTIVCKTSKLPFKDNTFDVIYSTECFEHDPEFDHSIQKIISLLKDNGLFFFTCASTGRPEHGTRNTTPFDSYGTIGNVDGWVDHYKNITFEDLKNACTMGVFTNYQCYYNKSSCDLYFWGIKNGSTFLNIEPFIYANTILIDKL